MYQFTYNALVKIFFYLVEHNIKAVHIANLVYQSLGIKKTSQFRSLFWISGEWLFAKHTYIVFIGQFASLIMQRGGRANDYSVNILGIQQIFVISINIEFRNILLHHVQHDFRSICHRDNFNRRMRVDYGVMG